MNQYLKAAANRYEKKVGKEFLINPISNVDAEVIVELSELLKKAGLSQVSAILKEYKFKKDVEIRDLLLDFNTNFKERIHPIAKLANKVATSPDSEILEDEETEPEQRFIGFNDLRYTTIKKTLILGYRLLTLIDQDTDVEYSSIIINECDVLATKKPMYDNLILSYEDEETRDEDVEMLEMVLNS